MFLKNACLFPSYYDTVILIPSNKRMLGDYWNSSRRLTRVHFWSHCAYGEYFWLSHHTTVITTSKPHCRNRHFNFYWRKKWSDISPIQTSSHNGTFFAIFFTIYTLGVSIHDTAILCLFYVLTKTNALKSSTIRRLFFERIVFISCCLL